MIIVICVIILVTLSLSVYFVRKYIVSQDEKAQEKEQLMDDLMSVVHGYFWRLLPNDMVIVQQSALDRLGVSLRVVPLDFFFRYIEEKYRQPWLDAVRHPSPTNSRKLEIAVKDPKTNGDHTLIVLVNPALEGDSKYVSTGVFQIIDRACSVEIESAKAHRQSELTTAKESFLATMGHEIRNPLNVIVGYAELLTSQFREVDDETRAMYGEQIMESNAQLLDLLDGVMDRTESTAKELRMELNRRNVSTFMEDIYLTHRVIVPKRLEFNFQRGPENIFFKVNRSAMLQVISNLMNNAIKFTVRGSITLGWTVVDDNVVIFVQDTGMGVPEENLGKIFSTYYKEDNHSVGAGIGLSLCRYLVEKMNGTIRVKSEVGKGSRFEICLKVE